MNELLTVLGLAVAGIDPVGAVVLAGAIGAGLGRAKIIGFSLATLLSAVVTGSLFSVIGIEFIDQIRAWFPGANSSVWFYVNIGLALLIIAWLVRKRKSGLDASTGQTTKRQLKGGVITVAALGAVFGVSSLLDPTFIATIGVAAQTNSLPAIISAHTIWIVCSQFMLFGLAAAHMLGKHRQLLEWSAAFWRKHKPGFVKVVRITALLMSLLLLADSAAYALWGRYLLINGFS